MNKSETIFFAVIIMAYVLCALTLDIPLFMHMIFAALLLVIVTAAILLKYKTQIENEKAGKIFQILSIIFLVCYILATISEIWFSKAPIIDSGIFLLLFLLTFIIGWFLKKEKIKS